MREPSLHITMVLHSCAHPRSEQRSNIPWGRRMAEPQSSRFPRRATK